VLALVGLVSYLGLEWQARSQVRETLAGFTDIVQLAPRPPTLTLTLP
jgi:type VI secretion system protein ImpK